MRSPTAGSMWLMRLTWATALVFPLPAYALLLWFVQWNLASTDPGHPYRQLGVGTFGVGWDVAAEVAVALAAAWAVPWLVHRRAVARLRRRAREEVDARSSVSYRAAPPRVTRLPVGCGALEAARARFAGRSAATLAVVAVVDLAFFFWLVPLRGFPCVGYPGSLDVPSPGAWGALLAVVAAYKLLVVPTRGRITGPLRDLLVAGSPSAR
jgi:hypothetical protein